MPTTAPRTPPLVEYRVAVGTEAKLADNKVHQGVCVGGQPQPFDRDDLGLGSIQKG
jgi:hypothetical protein